MNKLILTVLSLSFCLGQSTPRFAAAYARALAGQGNINICGGPGDSVMQGYPSTTLGSWFNQIQIGSLPSVQGISVYGVAAGGSDPRWSVGSGWVTTSNFGLGGSALYGGPTAGPITFTPGTGNFDGFVVEYLSATWLGGFPVSATGGSTINVDASQGTGFSFVTVMAGAAGVGNTLTIGTPTGPAAVVIAVTPILSTATGQVHLGNIGVDSSGTQQWTGTSSIQALAALQSLSCDLYLEALEINDAGSWVTVADYIANKQAIITAIKAAADVVLVIDIPSGTEPNSDFEAAYYPALLSLAETNNIPVLDLYGLFAKQGCGGGTITSSCAFYSPWMFDTRHPSYPTGAVQMTAAANTLLNSLAQPATTATVPNVAGQTLSQAITAITGAGLTLGAITMASSATVAAGSVISETPAAGSSVAVGSTVALVISTGPSAQPTGTMTCTGGSVTMSMTIPGTTTINVPVTCSASVN